MKGLIPMATLIVSLRKLVSALCSLRVPCVVQNTWKTTKSRVMDERAIS